MKWDIRNLIEPSSRLDLTEFNRNQAEIQARYGAFMARMAEERVAMGFRMAMPPVMVCDPTPMFKMMFEDPEAVSRVAAARGRSVA